MVARAMGQCGMDGHKAMSSSQLSDHGLARSGEEGALQRDAGRWLE
jgi:hypothetical protein